MTRHNDCEQDRLEARYDPNNMFIKEGLVYYKSPQSVLTRPADITPPTTTGYFNTLKEFRVLYALARQSPDPSTKNAASIVTDDNRRLAAFNTIHPSMRRPERLERPLKYSFIAHAEEAAVCQASYYGAKTSGAEMFAIWAPCPVCARLIVNSGIKRLTVHAEAMDRTPKRWLEAVAIGQEILRDAGVEYVFWDGKVDAGEHTMDGKIWTT